MELVLPTLEQVGNMRFDCHDPGCVADAERWQEHCGHDLLICHQVLENSQFQLVMRHGDGEACLVLFTGPFALDEYDEQAIGWIDAVHAYEGQDFLSATPLNLLHITDPGE